MPGPRGSTPGQPAEEIIIGDPGATKELGLFDPGQQGASALAPPDSTGAGSEAPVKFGPGGKLPRSKYGQVGSKTFPYVAEVARWLRREAAPAPPTQLLTRLG